MPQWLKLGIAYVLGVVTVESHGHIFVQAGNALAGLLHGLGVG